MALFALAGCRLGRSPFTDGVDGEHRADRHRNDGKGGKAVEMIECRSPAGIREGRSRRSTHSTDNATARTPAPVRSVRRFGCPSANGAGAGSQRPPARARRHPRRDRRTRWRRQRASPRRRALSAGTESARTAPWSRRKWSTADRAARRATSAQSRAPTTENIGCDAHRALGGPSELHQCRVIGRREPPPVESAVEQLGATE